MTMKHAFLGAVVLVGTLMPATAQYYPAPPQGGYYPPQREYYPPQRDYYPPPRPPRGYYTPDPYGGGYYQRPVQYGNVCYTSRGTCRTRPTPVTTSCACNIPGFGVKRGAVVDGGW
jgi:hypothetical protein